MRGGDAAALPHKRMTGSMRVLAAVWLLVLFDPLWLFASWGMQPILRLNTVAFSLLLVVVVNGMMTNRLWQRRWTSFAPMIVFTLTCIPGYFVAVNTGFARNGIKVFFFWWLLIVATVAMVGTAQRAEQLLRLYGVQFLWWVIWGGPAALVGWGWRGSRTRRAARCMCGCLGTWSSSLRS